MKSGLAVIVLLMSLLMTGAHSASAAQKHALLIGISNYGYFYPDVPEDSRLFPNLNCDSDVQAIQAALVHTFAFNPDPGAGQITVLDTPEKTTREAIIAALSHLVDVTGPGDIIYIHYSGHGDQILDPTEPSGYDSALVPTDYQTPAPEAKTEASANEISGKTILSYVNKLRAKKTAQIILSFDCCHSASAVRGAAPQAKARGITSEAYISWYKNHHPKYTPAAIIASPSADGASAQDDLNGTGYVVISACRNTQSAYETQKAPVMGRLSYCLAKVLTEATPQTTFREAFDQVYAMFHQNFTDQDPQLDGSDPDASVMDGQAVSPVLYYLVLVDKTGAYSLNAGTFQDMSVGSQFTIYDSTDDTYKDGTEIAKAQITKVSQTGSLFTITWKKPGLTSDELSGAHALETNHQYSTPPVTLDAASLHKELPDQADSILAKLADKDTGLGMVSTTAGADGFDIACTKVGGQTGLVRTSSGSVIAILDPSRSDLPDQVYTALQKEARYAYACGLGVGQGGLNHAYHLALKVVATDANGVPLQDASSATTDQRTTLLLGTYFAIQVQNKSARSLHVAVLDLESSGSIGPIWPPPGTTSQDNIVAPTHGDEWKTLWVNSDTTQPAVFQAATLDSDEMFKAIGTVAAEKDGDQDEYVDFGPLATEGASRGPSSPFSSLFGPAVDSGTRGPVSSIDPGTWTAATVPFQVAAAK